MYNYHFIILAILLFVVYSRFKSWRLLLEVCYVWFCTYMFLWSECMGLSKCLCNFDLASIHSKIVLTRSKYEVEWYIRWVITFSPNLLLLFKHVKMCPDQWKDENIFWVSPKIVMTLRIILLRQSTWTWTFIANANIINWETQIYHVWQ